MKAGDSDPTKKGWTEEEIEAYEHFIKTASLTIYKYVQQTSTEDEIAKERKKGC
jgi:hypothetical protein